MTKMWRNLLGAVIVAAIMLFGSGCRSHHVSAGRGSAASRPAPVQHIDYNDSRLQAPAVALLREADSWIGVPYRYGGDTRKGVDCSALVLNVFEKSLSIKMPRNSRKQAEFCSSVSRDNLIEGDLLFFSTPSSREIGHVGIYIGNDCMIHSSSSRGVIVSRITDDYYRRHFKKAGRVDAYVAMLDDSRRRRRKRFTPEPYDAIWAASPPPSPEPAAGKQPEPSADSAPGSIPTSIPASTPTAEAVAEPQPGPAATTAAPQPEPVATTPVGKPETVAGKPEIKIVKPATAASTAPSPESLSAEEARRRVLQSFREQPADSVLTPYFD